MAVTPVYPSNKYDNQMSASQLVVDNVADFRERTIYDVVDDATGETTLNYPSLTLYDAIDDFNLGEGYITASNAFIIATSIITSLSPKQQNYLMKEKELKIIHLTRLARKMSFDIKRLKEDMQQIVTDAGVSNIFSSDESRLPSSQSIRSHLGQ